MVKFPNIVTDTLLDVGASLVTYQFIGKPDLIFNNYRANLKKIYKWFNDIFTTHNIGQNIAINNKIFSIKKAYTDIKHICIDLLIHIMQQIINENIIINQKNSTNGKSKKIDATQVKSILVMLENNCFEIDSWQGHTKEIIFFSKIAKQISSFPDYFSTCLIDDSFYSDTPYSHN